VISVSLTVPVCTIRLMGPLTPLHYFVMTSVGVALLLFGLVAVAPRTWYGWSSPRRKLLGQWRVEMGVLGIAIFVGTAVAVLVVLAPQ
jgi:hypothetical protein